MFRKILYDIDILNTTYCSGWCFHRLFRQSPVLLSFFQNARLIGETISELYREDLFEQNLHPTGLCGFEYVFSEQLRSGFDQPLSIHANGASKPIVEILPEQIINTFEPINKPVVFMHIPKTAGTSFNNYVAQHLGYQKCKPHIETLSLAEQKSLPYKFDYLAGHLTLEAIIRAFGDLPDVETTFVSTQSTETTSFSLSLDKGNCIETWK